MKTLRILAPGSEVSVNQPGSVDTIPGYITSVQINPNFNVRYLVAWWEDFTRHDEWLEDMEISLLENSKEIVIEAQEGE